MLKLKELRFGAIGRFVEPQTIRFDSLGNIVQLDGQNNNTGGSSGSAKSTVANAVDYLFGLNDIPNTVLQSRLTKEAIWVEGDFDLDGKPMLLKRGKGKLRVELDGVVTEGANKLAEEKLDEILGMSRKLFRLILHKRQKEGGFFLNYTPKEMYEFLTSALGLSEHQNKINKLDLKIKELEVSKIKMESEFAASKAGVSATQDAILALGLAPVRDMHREVVLELKAKADASATILAGIQTVHQQQINELDATRPVPQSKLYDKSILDGLVAERQALQERIVALESLERDRLSNVRQLLTKNQGEQTTHKITISHGDNAKKHASDLATQIKKIREAICPCCEQSWITEAAKAKEATLLTQLTDLKSKIGAGNESAKQLESVLEEAKRLQKESEPKNDPEIDNCKGLMQELLAKIGQESQKEQEFVNGQHHLNRVLNDQFAEAQKVLRIKHNQEIEQARGQADVDSRALQAAVSKLKAYEDARVRYETALKNLKDNESAYQERSTATQAQLTRVAREFLIAEEAKRAIKSFISCSFDDALDDISDAATAKVRCIPNMANATVQFQGVRETKEGKVKEEVNAELHMDGEESVPIRSLSGGERSSLDLAIDLSVINFLEEKTGKGIDVFFLDEPFTGLEAVNIEQVLELLQHNDANKKLVIVDHNPVVAEFMSDKILIVRDGQTSKVQDSNV